MVDYLTKPLVDLHLGEPVVADGVASIGPLTIILPLIAALIISMVIIPVMVRLAPRLGMIDMPDPRKVHASPIPRVGGFGIVIGALLPVILLLPLDNSMLAFVFGALALFGFGILDDSRELGHYVKFIGQFVAAIAVVYFGDVYVTWLPLMDGEAVSPSIGRPFTVVALVGMINAINHSDGLDGLAGGESLLSLACITYLAYLAGGTTVTVIAVATIGGVFGFMRFNTYPARIFMGDGGSQFLGYTLGVLAVMLTQQVNPALSPALPVLILGLPIADIIAVFAQRIYHKMNWFRASRNHIHHRLLDLGFHHYESVIFVYSVQALLVTLAVILSYDSDAMILGVYLVVIAAVFILLTSAERIGWHLRAANEEAVLDNVIEAATHTPYLQAVPFTLVFYGISIFLLISSLLATNVPVDFTWVSVVLTMLLFVRLLMGDRAWYLPLRPLVYVGIVFVVYLSSTYQPEFLAGADPITYIFFGLLVTGIGLSIRFSKIGKFDVTPMDYLVVLAVLVIAILANSKVVGEGMTAIALKSIILFYGCELILTRMEGRLNAFTVSMLISLLVLGVRGLVMNY